MRFSVIFRHSVLVLALLTVLTGLIYPLAIYGIAQVAWPAKANGSIVRSDKGDVIGSELLGQEFTRPEYFWSRPSATSPAYNAGASSGSNLGPLNETLEKNVATRVSELKAADAEPSAAKTKPPIDLVTSSGSGLDPHISVAAARYQAARVARLRNLSQEDVSKLIDNATEAPQFGILGMQRVNVLKLNQSLDKLNEAKK